VDGKNPIKNLSIITYPFGMQMPGRSFSSGSYRYGWQGQEMVNEINGVGGSHYTAEYWEYDSRLGRRWNLDPVYKHYISNYAVLGNNPILMIDPNGADWYISNGEDASDEPVWLPNDEEATGLYGEGAFINLSENLLTEVVVTTEGNSTGKSYNVPDYLINAKGEHGVTETPGAENNPRILEYHATTLNGQTGEPCTSDADDWCASFTNWNIEQVGREGNDNPYSANAWSYRYNSNVVEIDRPAVGSIALINNSHVTFVVGVNGNYIHGFGGNQNDQVKISTYSNANARYFIPVGVTPNYDVPTIQRNFNTQQNESTR
jgi:uncharacterized protein (TIGR02594 family)